MHESGRMLLALYANGVLRLWNMLDGRCLFKKKVGMSAKDSESEGDDTNVNEEDEMNDEEREDRAATKRL